ncbi:MAG: molybdenum cofactor biosynthesis protein, partial [Pseudomonadota bacterium]
MNSPAFKPLNIAVLTVSDTRSLDDDLSGQTLSNGLTAAGHAVYDRLIVIDNIYKIRAVISLWFAIPEVDVI